MNPTAVQVSSPARTAWIACGGLCLRVARKLTLPPSWSFFRVSASVRCAAPAPFFRGHLFTRPHVIEAQHAPEPRRRNRPLSPHARDSSNCSASSRREGGTLGAEAQGLPGNWPDRNREFAQNCLSVLQFHDQAPLFNALGLSCIEPDRLDQVKTTHVYCRALNRTGLDSNERKPEAKAWRSA